MHFLQKSINFSRSWTDLHLYWHCRLISFSMNFVFNDWYELLLCPLYFHCHYVLFHWFEPHVSCGICQHCVSLFRYEKGIFGAAESTPIFYNLHHKTSLPFHPFTINSSLPSPPAFRGIQVHWPTLQLALHPSFVSKNEMEDSPSIGAYAYFSPRDFLQESSGRSRSSQLQAQPHPTINLFFDRV